jgi:hypothetical protein
VRPGALTIPAVLAVSALAVAAGCPSDDTAEPMEETGDPSGGQDLPDCPSIEDEALCGQEYGCVWYPDLAICVVACSFIEDQQTCEEQGFCYWTANDACDFGGI